MSDQAKTVAPNKTLLGTSHAAAFFDDHYFTFCDLVCATGRTASFGIQYCDRVSVSGRTATFGIPAQLPTHEKRGVSTVQQEREDGSSTCNNMLRARRASPFVTLLWTHPSPVRLADAVIVCQFRRFLP